ncbi:DNA replication/repair protein RecF [Sphingomonas sp. SRS2]|uniref:DNA replication/repair protein RecF n=1 Tax=Sphingomonas sp. SRS2 TaxID=133190 RepID=UPI0006184077|nr:DNA replication/repair protein RecF [Sphingomonas sp. SRS2]KKC24614.1 recombinase RecF [Sphingomonas sp. SRS2]
MTVARLMLTDFRSYAAATIAAGPGFVVLTGENGAGKTNILEAISMLGPGRGLRGAALGEMAREGGGGGFAVAAELAGDVRIGTGTTAAAPDRRQVRINGATASATSLGEWMALLWLTPAMDRLFTEGAEGRRRFLDRLVFAIEPGHAHHASRYDAAMRARNKLLAQEGRPDIAWLDALEVQLAEHGAAVAEARARTVAALADRIAAEPDAPFARASLSIEGWLPGAAPLIDELRQGRARDAAAGRTLAGPHRQDLAVVHAAKAQPAARASTGEQKALLLGLVLAHADLVAERRGQRPVLLMDEVAAHLDPVRRAALFDRLARSGGQIWLTGTERALFDGIGAATWLSVRAGMVDIAR